MNFETVFAKIRSRWHYLFEVVLISNVIACIGGLLIKYHSFYFNPDGWKGVVFYLGNLVFVIFIGLFISSSVQLGIALLKYEIQNRK